MSLSEHPLASAATLPFERANRIYEVFKYHRRQGDEAREKYANIVSQDPSRALSPTQLSEIDDYAHETFGDIRYAPWLVTYAAVSREFRPGCIPDNYVGIYMLKHLVGDWRHKLRRTQQKLVLDTELIPDILRCEDGLLLFPDNSPVPIDQLGSILFVRGNSAYLKLSSSNQGRGIQVLRKEDFHPDMLPLERDFVIQHTLRHDPDFDRFNPNAATTVRLTTVIKDGRADTREAHMRFVRDGLAHLRTGVGSSVSLDKITGAYFSHGVVDGWTIVDRHPDTGEIYAGNHLPHFAAMKTACETLHEKVPGVAWLGWDLCPLANGEFAIMEVNAGHADIKFAEAMHGPNFADLGWETLHRQHSIF